MKITAAIILAGGAGTRLQAAVPGVSKCLATVNNQPFIDYLLNHLQNQGIEKFIFAIGYGAEMVQQYLDKRWPSLSKIYSIETTFLGTGGAVKKALEIPGERQVLIVNGDTLFEFELEKAAQIHETSGAEISILLKPLKDFDRYGTVELNEARRVIKFKEKQAAKSGLINAGTYLLDVEQWKADRWPDQFSFEKDYLEAKCSEVLMNGIIEDKYFIDIGVPADYNKAQIDLRPA